MSTSLPTSFVPETVSRSEETPPERSPAATHLAALDPGQAARVTDVHGDVDGVAWLAAVGIGRGEHLTLLRRAPFGGPLHVRTSSGGEFALDRRLAETIVVALLGVRGGGAR